ncbi:MAG TPA: 3-hydroxyacyl-CoA dehydrogenase NAD-binding domain-containing protein [Solirubrobacterales bacterium]|jgi:enoyl-CoA hydratase/3-hydroxyacyl-CoA dehydrogenase|nr:3-hydroxyacyl-CoA dehydrogenase NAD-binding domain-containing protein [Solirubrobacterales bacterium]
MFVSKAAVVGGGTMGGEIAQAIAAADIPVVVKDIDRKFVDAALEKARAVTEGQLSRLVKKEKLTPEQADARLAEVMGLVTGTTSYAEFGDVDFVVEAVPERMEIKQAVFRELDAATPGHAILASNTSSLSITEMAESTLRPDKVVGFHFFYPASVMPLVEVIAGEDTSEETATVAYNFAQAIKKQPIVCGEVPGFVVNRILMATIGEIWRVQEEQGLSLKAIDEAIAAAKVAPMGPFFLTDLLGLDTVLHVAEHLGESYGETFYVHRGLKQLVADGKLGAKSGGEGFFKEGEQNVPGDGEPDAEELVALFTCRALIEACLLVEEGVCSVRDIDLGMMAGAGLDPRKGLLPPFWKADVEGLDAVLERMEGLQERHGGRFTPPVLLRRLVAQGRLGLKSGQGFYPYPQPDEGDQAETVKLETRGEVAIAWLANAPMNAVSPDMIRDLKTVWERVKASGEVGAMVIVSSVPVVFSAGADIKAFTRMDEGGGEELIHTAHALLRDFGQARVSTVAAVNAIAFGGGCEVAMACDVRIAAEAAVFGQPEVKLGIIPGFGGTQRLPRLVGPNKALEMNLIGDAILAGEALESGLVNRVVPDHELFETALMWGRKLAAQAPLAVEQIKTVSHAGDLDQGIEAEKQGFATAFRSADAKEGISAFLGKRTPKWSGK